MSYSQDKGIITRGIIVEMCRTGATGIELAAALGLSIQQVRKQCQRLKDERYITYAHELGKTHLYQTISEDKYHEPGDLVNVVPAGKEKPIPGARVYNFDILEKKHPDYFKQPLRKMEFRGIGSTFSLMDS